MPLVSIPDDFPAVLATSEAFPTLRSFAEIDYHASLPGSEDDLIERIRHADAVLNIRCSTGFTERVLAACPQVRLISVWGTGMDHVDLAAAARHRVTVANTPGVSAIAIAEHALALLLGVARRLPEMDTAVRNGGWPRGRFVQLAGKVCGIVGYGAIGREFARLASGIGMRVVMWTMHPTNHPGVTFTSLDELYAVSDVVSLHLRLRPRPATF